MKFQFKIQSFQTEAAESVVRVFAGQSNVGASKYRRDVGNEKSLTDDERLERRGYMALTYATLNTIGDGPFCVGAHAGSAGSGRSGRSSACRPRSSAASGVLFRRFDREHKKDRPRCAPRCAQRAVAYSN